MSESARRLPVRYNHLRVKRLVSGDRDAYPDYPIPWFVIIDDDDVILGDGQTEASAKEDFSLRRGPGSPSLEAVRRLRRERVARRRRRERSRRNP